MHESISCMHYTISVVSRARVREIERLSFAPLPSRLGPGRCLPIALARPRAGLSPSHLEHRRELDCAVACWCYQHRSQPARCTRLRKALGSCCPTNFSQGHLHPLWKQRPEAAHFTRDTHGAGVLARETSDRQFVVARACEPQKAVLLFHWRPL